MTLATTDESSSSFLTEKEKIGRGAILHCWCWSFRTIEARLEKIARAGFAAIQTSPANACRIGDGGGLEIMSRSSGKWYYHYQPIDWKIGNYQLGTRDEFISMCAAAHKKNIAVIVDIVPNHTTPYKDEISGDFLRTVGGMEKMYHANATHRISDFFDRRELVSANLCGLPDVNTENPLYQEYLLGYANDLISCGADGLRFDAAKHIALPDDPLDARSERNDFWEVFTGRKSVRGKRLEKAESLFLYGEVLQEGCSREEAYEKFFPVTASLYGEFLRGALKEKNLDAEKIPDFQNKASRLVTWVESHDTYANEGESADLTNFQIRAGWAVIAARKCGTPLFFSRPKGREATQFPGESKIGDAGNDEFFCAEIAALNGFRNAMQGESEQFSNGENQKVLTIKRGEKGIVIINMDSRPQKINARIELREGAHIDRANNTEFFCRNGILGGTIGAEKICVIY